MASPKSKALCTAKRARAGNRTDKIGAVSVAYIRAALFDPDLLTDRQMPINKRVAGASLRRPVAVLALSNVDLGQSNARHGHFLFDLIG